MRYFFQTRGSWGEKFTELMRNRFRVEVIHVSDMTWDAKSSYEQGYNATIKSHLDQKFGLGTFFYWGSGAVRSIGLESDALLTTLAELYGQSVPPRPMRLETRVAIVGLADDPRLLPNRPTRMKLFFESEDPDDYAEVYVNVIGPEGRIELHEKDPEYRKPLVRALGK